MARTGHTTKILKMRGPLLLVLALTLGSWAKAQNPKPGQDSTSAARGRRRVVVSIPDRELAVLESGRVLRTFPVAVGAAVSPSPAGRFEIVSRLSSPTYYHAGVVIPPGSDNPVGSRWIGINRKGYGIHGTNEPRSIGHAASHGCIRLRNRDVEQLYRLVRVGDVVEIRGRRDEQIAHIFGGDSVIARVQPAAMVNGQ